MNNRGFTVLEVVVAIVVFTIGILGLAGTAASVTRMIGRGQQSNKAAYLAAGRLEILRATRCADMTSGSAADGRYSVTWTVSDTANAKKIIISVVTPTAAGNRTETNTSYISCLI